MMPISLGMGLGLVERGAGTSGGGSSTETQIILAGWQSNLSGGQTTALGATLVSPADDAQTGLNQWSPNGGGPYSPGGVEPNPGNARTLLAASGGGLLYPQTIDVNRVGPMYSFMKAAATATSKPILIIPFGVGGTSINEYFAAGGLPSNWPTNRYTVMKTAYDTYKAFNPDSRIYAFCMSILENEIANTLGAANVQGWLSTIITDFRALGGPGASDAPFIFSSPLWEYIGPSTTSREYLEQAAKFCVATANCGFIRRPLGYSVGGDTIHMTNVGNRVHGPQMHAWMAVTAALNAAPAPVPAVSLTGEQVNIVSDGAPYYEIDYRAPAGSGAYTTVDYVPREYNGVGSTMKFVAPGQGGRDIIVRAMAKGGNSAAASSSGSTPMLTYAVPAVTPPTPTVILDIDNASLDGSSNIISIPSTGSDTTAWTPTAAAGQGATAALKRTLIGSKYGLILDSTSKSVWRGSAFVFPSGDFSAIMPMYVTASVTGTFIAGAQSGTSMDMLIALASSGTNLKAGFVNTTTQLLTATAFLANNFTTLYPYFFGFTYRRTGNFFTAYLNDEVILSGTPTQRAASPANSGGTRLYNVGLDTATSGWGGTSIAFPPRFYNAELSFNEYQKIKNDYRVDHGVAFGYTPT